MKYKVSIILPIYNVENFLKNCLETLVNQTLKEIEIIAVNDCSTDNSLKILNEYQQRHKDRFKVINSKVNVKQGGARNLGIEIATGEYIGFVDPDDYVTLDMFEKMYNSAIENNSDIVTCDYFEVTSGNETYMKNDIPEGVVNKEFKIKVLQRKYGWELWQQIYKREIFTENKIEFSENLYVTDLEVGAIMFMYAKKVSKISEALYYYVKHDSATTTFKPNDKKVYDLITVSDKRMQHFKERGFYEDYKEEIDYIYFWHVCVVSVSRCVINFSTPQYAKMEELKGKITNNIPNIRNNKYYQHANTFNKLILNLLFINKYALVCMLKTGKLIPRSFIGQVKKLLK